MSMPCRLAIAVTLLSSGWCPALEFSLRTKPFVELTEPADGGTTYMTHPQFRWTENSSADRYEIQIARDAGFQALEQTDSIPVPRYVPLDGLPAGSTYWWRVRPQLAGGAAGAWSPARQLAVLEPARRYTVSTNDSIGTITGTIAAAAAHTPATLVFEPGTYRVALPADTWLFDFLDVQDLIIDGAGSTIVIDNPNSGFSHFKRCKNILLRRFAVDYFTTNGIPTTHTAGTVVSVDPANASFVFQPLANYLPPDHPVIRDATQRRWGCLMDTNTPGRLKFNVPNWFDFQPQVDPLGGNQYRLYLIPGHASRIAYFKPGDTFVKSATWGEFVMYSTISSDITYERITSYAGGANHFIGHWNNGVNFLRCASRIKAGRLVSNGCGGYVGAGYRTGFWIEECLTEGMFDDAVNISNEPAKIQAKTAANQFVATGAAAQYILAGDRVTIYTPTAGTVNGTFAVLSNTVSGGLRYITVDGDIGAVDPGTENWNTGVYNDALAHPHAYVRNSTFRNSRRFGCLFKSHGGVIEGNAYYGLSEVAIEAENECSSFDGGFDCRNVRILNNTAIDCGYSSTSLAQNHGSIEFGIAAYGTTCKQTVHRGIEIRGNTVYDWDGMGIAVTCAQDVQIVSNTVKQLNSTGFYPGGNNYGIYLNYTDQAEITGNDLRDTRPMDAPIQVENSTRTAIHGNLTP